MRAFVSAMAIILASSPFANQAKAGEDPCHFPDPFRVVTRDHFPTSVREAVVKDGLDDVWVSNPKRAENMHIGNPITEIGWQQNELFVVWTLSGDVIPPFRIISAYRVKTTRGAALLVKRTEYRGDDAGACRVTRSMLRK